MKKFLMGNLGTMLMSLFLATLLWVYLYSESNDVRDLEVAFHPKVTGTREQFARIVYLDEGGKRRREGSTTRVRIRGPKGELRQLSKKELRLEPVLSGDFSNPTGRFTRKLEPGDLNLPEHFRVEFTGMKEITVDYVRFVTAKRKVAPPGLAGTPAAGFEVKGVSVHPSEAEIRFPADRELKEIRLEPISVRQLAATKEEEAKLADADPQVRLITPVTIKAVIEPRKAQADFTVPIVMAGPRAVTSRLELATKEIKVRVVGSDQAVRWIKENPGPARLYAFVIVDRDEANLVAQFALTKIFCLVLHEEYSKEVEVEVMPDVKAENRQVEVKLVK